MMLGARQYALCRCREGGVLTRPGHTEAAVDLARLAGCQPAGDCTLDTSCCSYERIVCMRCCTGEILDGVPSSWYAKLLIGASLSMCDGLH